MGCRSNKHRLMCCVEQKLCCCENEGEVSVNRPGELVLFQKLSGGVGEEINREVKGAISSAVIENEVSSTLKKGSCVSRPDELTPQPSNVVRMQFRTLLDGIVELDFSDKAFPLGIIFSDKSPRIVDGVRKESSAAGLGVSPGWVLLQLNGVEVDKMKVRPQKNSCASII